MLDSSLEETSGIPRGNLSRIENHLTSATLDTIEEYANALGKSVRLVIVDDEPEPSKINRS